MQAENHKQLQDTWAIHYAARFHRALVSMKARRSQYFKSTQKTILQFESTISDPNYKEAYLFFACKIKKISEQAQELVDYWLTVADNDCAKPRNY